jgi:hypothetical protein
LEIACERKPIKTIASQDQVVLVEWVWELYEIGKVLEAADPTLNGDFDEQEMEHLMIVGLWCAHPYRNFKPSIRKTILVLNFDTSLPILPSDMSGPTHPAPAMNRNAMSLSVSRVATNYDGGQNQYSGNNYTNFTVFTSSSTACESASLLHMR